MIPYTALQNGIYCSIKNLGGNEGREGGREEGRGKKASSFCF